MNSWEKSSLELTPATEMTLSDDNGRLSVLIKHDYYSSDTESGRILLGSFLDSLAECGDALLNVFLVDSAVRLLYDPYLSAKLSKLLSLSRYSYICEESLAAFDVEYDSHDNVIVCPASDISMQIIQSAHLVTLS